MSLSTVILPTSASATGAERPRTAWWRPLVIPLALLLLWEIVAETGTVRSALLPGPGQIARRALEEFGADDMLGHLLASLRRDLIGFASGSATGIAAGLILGFSPPAQKLLKPLLLAQRQIALFAWVPLISMWFGGDEAGKLVFIALAAFQPTFVNTWQGVAGVPPAYRELAAVLGFRWLDRVVLIALPGALPRIFSGLHAALIYAWTATIGAELLFNVAPGIGGRMNEGQQLFHMDLLLLCILLLGAVGVSFNFLAQSFEHRLGRRRIP